LYLLDFVCIVLSEHLKLTPLAPLVVNCGALVLSSSLANFLATKFLLLGNDIQFIQLRMRSLAIGLLQSRQDSEMETTYQSAGNTPERYAIFNKQLTDWHKGSSQRQDSFVLSVFDSSLRPKEIRDLTNKIATGCFCFFFYFFIHYMESRKDADRNNCNSFVVKTPPS